MIQVGIVGLGPVWETRYLPALLNLRARIRTRAVYDSVATRGAMAADQLGAYRYQSIQSLLERPEVRAILLLDVGWQGTIPLNFICRSGKPAYIAGSLGSDLHFIHQLRDRAGAEGWTLMPEFGRRFTPATSRLQELMATHLGRPRRMEIDAVLPAGEAIPGQGTGGDFLVGLIDWCCYVARLPPRRVVAEPSRETSARVVMVEFQHPRSGETVTARLRLRAPNGSRASSPLLHDVTCERGRATLDGAMAVTWQCDEDAVHETLSSDRSDVEVMLDHFCRRVAGGLIPVADVADVCRSLELVQAAEESRRRGEPVEV